MSPQAILERLERLGVTVLLTGDCNHPLRLTPADRIPLELRPEVVAHKAELAELVARQAGVWRADPPDVLWPSQVGEDPRPDLAGSELWAHLLQLASGDAADPQGTLWAAARCSGLRSGAGAAWWPVAAGTRARPHRAAEHVGDQGRLGRGRGAVAPAQEQGDRVPVGTAPPGRSRDPGIAGAAVIRFTVPVEPVPMARPRVALRGGRAHAYVPSHASEAMWQIRQAAIAALGDAEPFAGPLSVEIVAWVRRPASIPKCRRETALPTKRPDLDNYVKTALDGCSPLWVDDSQVVDLHASKRYAVTGSPRWVIEVEELP